MQSRNSLLAVLLIGLISSPAWATPAGKLVGWGNNDFGQTNVPAGDDFVAIAAGRDHGLAIQVPEPASWTLVGIAFVATLAQRRRTQRR
jgi:hypothetical protein